MKIKYKFESVNMGEEIIMVPVGENANQVQGVIKANEAGNRIIQLLIQGKDENEVVDSLVKEFDNDRGMIADYVRSVITVLQDHQLIE